jgi:hypothetical protein
VLPVIAELSLVALPPSPEVPPLPAVAVDEVSPSAVASPVSRFFLDSVTASPECAVLPPVAAALALPPSPAMPESPPAVQLTLPASPLCPVHPVSPESPEVTTV